MRNHINGLAGGALWLVFITAVFAIFGLFMINTPDARWALVVTVAISLALAAIIGLHFIPLAWIFDRPRYYALGLHFCAIAAVTLLVIPAAETIGQVRLWYVFPSLGVAPVVWAVAWCNLREANRELATVRAAQ